MSKHVSVALLLKSFLFMTKHDLFFLMIQSFETCCELGNKTWLQVVLLFPNVLLHRLWTSYVTFDFSFLSLSATSGVMIYFFSNSLFTIHIMKSDINLKPPKTSERSVLWKINRNISNYFCTRTHSSKDFCWLCCWKTKVTEFKKKKYWHRANYNVIMHL